MVAKYSAASVDAKVPMPAAKMLLSVERVLFAPILFDDLLLFFVFRNDDDDDWERSCS